VHWLNTNSGAIQALGSIASVFITGVLAFITWKYVRLTDRLLSEQMEARAAQLAASRRELRAHMALLSSFLYALPSMDDERLLGAILDHSNDLRDFSFSRFRALASEVSIEAAARASELETDVKWLTNLFQEIGSAPWSRSAPSINEPLGSPGSGVSNGYHWGQFPKRDYDKHWRFAIGALEKVTTQVDIAEGLRR